MVEVDRVVDARRPQGVALQRRVVLAMIKAAGRGRWAAALDLLPHVPGDGDHGVPLEWWDPRAHSADRRARVAKDDEALRPDGGHSDGRTPHTQNRSVTRYLSHGYRPRHRRRHPSGRHAHVAFEDLVVCPLNKLTLDLRGVSTVWAGIAVRRPVRRRASNRKIISGTYH